MLKVFGAQWCDYCKRLKDYLVVNNIEHEFVDIDIKIEESLVLIEKDLQTIPQVWIGDKHIGGHDDTIEFLESLEK